MVEDVMQKLERTNRFLKKKAGWEDIDVTQARLAYNWANHAARVPAYRANPLTARFLFWRDRRRLLATACKNKGSQLH